MKVQKTGKNRRFWLKKRRRRKKKVTTRVSLSRAKNGRPRAHRSRTRRVGRYLFWSPTLTSDIKEPINIRLEREVEGYTMIFNLCNLGLKQPYFNSAYVVRVPIFSFIYLDVSESKMSQLNSGYHLHISLTRKTLLYTRNQHKETFVMLHSTVMNEKSSCIKTFSDHMLLEQLIYPYKIDWT